MRLALISALVFASPAFADPAIDYGWQGGTRQCVRSATDVTFSQSSSYQLIVAIHGFDQPFVAYEGSVVIMPADGGSFPDAWRYDAAGCQPEGAMTTWFFPPPVEFGCFPLVYNARPYYQAAAPIFDETAGRLRVPFRVEYRDGPVSAFEPAYPSVLAIMQFDIAQSVPTNQAGPGTCGGLERPMCFQLESVRFERPDHSMMEIDRPISIVTANAAALGGTAACTAVSARAATWGALRASYR